MSTFFKSLKRTFGSDTKKVNKEWDFDAKGDIMSSSLVMFQDDDGSERIIFGTKEGKLYSLNNHGEVQWTYDSKENISQTELMFRDIDTVNSISTTPGFLLNEDGKRQIIFGSELGVIYSLDDNGSLLWKIKTDGPIKAMPLIVDLDKNGTKEIIVSSGDKHLYIISHDGNILKKIECSSIIETTPLFVNNKLIVGTEEGVILAFNPDGSIAWNVKTGDRITARPVAMTLQTGQDVIIIPSHDNNVYALTFDGEIAWSFETGGAILSEVAIADVNRDGNKEICFGSCDNNIYCISDQGELIWSYETDFWVTTTPIITDVDKDNHMEIIAGSLDHRLYVLDGQGTYKLNYIPGVSGIVNQPGYHSKTINKDLGDQKGKKFCEYQVDDKIVGHTMVGNSNHVILNTKEGKIYSLKIR
mgnify:CR=1 FL=1